MPQLTSLLPEPEILAPGRDAHSQDLYPQPSPVAPLSITDAPRTEMAGLYHLTDSERDQSYDDLTTLAATLCGTPMSLLSFVEGGRQWFKSSIGVPADFLRTARDIAFCAHSILEPETVLEVEDTLQDPRFADNPMVQDVPHLRFYAGVPLLSPEGHPIGTLCVLDEKPNCLTEGARSGLISLARQASAQLELRRAVRELEAQTLSDSLTGAYNRRAFDRVLRDEWERHHRAASPLSLLLLDVDGFNHYIDNFGLQAGDAALQQITTAIQRPLQISNFVARYSGEQFAVVLQGTPTSAAAIVAEQIRESVNLQVWKNRSLTVSIGVASQQPTSELDRQTLVDRADHALYLAKQAGRNRVEIFKGWDHPLSNQHPLAGPVFIPYVPPASNPRGAA